MALSSEQRRILKQHAGPILQTVLGLPTPLWSEVGDDTRKELFDSLLARLRVTQNKGMADILSEHPKIAFECLQQKVRSMRYLQRKKNSELQDQPDIPNKVNDQDRASVTESEHAIFELGSWCRK
ncbi:hypothetical protein VM1G_10876 [Cytospora mali]|uniref:Uncharacterized protein n=1 Tax=Cytospora mali TaxID=578113 RepID=A0A194VIW0_CYTMA|nr:hypothetical protein VM1G_10876 [Valsa mali]